MFVSQSEEEDAGEGLFLKRGVNQNGQKLVSSLKSQIYKCLAEGNSRKLSGLLLWPTETEGRGELRFVKPFLFSDGEGRHEHQRQGGGACLCFWPWQRFTERVAAERGFTLVVLNLICRICFLTSLPNTGGAIA